MPNHVYNEVIFRGDPAYIEQIMKTIKISDGPIGTIDFDNIIPQPADLLDREDLSSTDHHTFLASLYGDLLDDDKNKFIESLYNGNLTDDNKIIKMDWWTWRIKFWGTKWNAYNFMYPIKENMDTVVFHTAWGAPTPIIKELSRMFPHVIIYHNYVEEFSQFAGHDTYFKGVLIENGILEIVGDNSSVFSYDDIYEFGDILVTSNQFYNSEEEF